MCLSQLPDDLKDAYKAAHDKTLDEATQRFLKKELFCKIWLLLLDDDFMAAYKSGFLVECGDGVRRRLFPRILTYSADYPEK